VTVVMQHHIQTVNPSMPAPIHDIDLSFFTCGQPVYMVQTLTDVTSCSHIKIDTAIKILMVHLYRLI